MGFLEDQEARRAISLFSEITGLIALPVVVGALVGLWIDDKYNSDPWFIIVGTLIGIMIATVSISSLVKKYTKK